MALNQIIQHSTGAYCNYWRVVNTNLDYNNKSANIVLYGYVSQEARDSNKVNLDTRIFVVNDTDFETYFIPSVIDPQGINQVKNTYLYIKTTPEFSTSTDI
jgi:hypothetical protein